MTGGRPGGRPKKRGRIVALMAAGACFSPVHAQVPAGQAITGQAAPRERPDAQPDPSSQTTPIAGPQAEQPQTSQAPSKFYIVAFDVAGARAIDQAVVENTVYDFAGPDRTPADVESARKALEDAYKARGYEAVQVDVPPQPEALFAQGIVQLRVTEAPIGRVRVTGSKYHALSVVRAQVPSIAEGKVLNTKSLERDLAGANRFPDRTVSPSFKAGLVPGTVDVDLAVEDSLPVHGSVDLTNDHSPSTRPLRLSASLSYANLWQQGHTLSATYSVAPQAKSQSEVISASYSAPFIGTPWTMVLYGYKSNSNVASLGGVNVLGDGYQIGLRGVYRLPSRTVSQSLTFGFDYKNFNQDISLNNAPTDKAPIEYMPVFLGYGLSAGSDNTNIDLNVSVTAGLRTFKKIGCFEVDLADCNANTQFDQFKKKGFDSNENFLHGNFDLTYRRAFAGDFVGTVKLVGQLSDSHLVTNEQFSIGGQSSLRGYFLSEAVGDSGYGASLEIASPSVASKLPGFVDELRLYAFVDHGQIKVIAPEPEQVSHYGLVSVGGGARIKLFKSLSGELTVAVPLQDGSTSKYNDVRTIFSARGEF